MSSDLPKILIVDDEVDICDMMQFTFNSRGFEAMIAHDAEQAFDIVKNHKLDVVVSDIRMPKGGGLGLLANIKAHNPDWPLVFLITGYSDCSAEQAVEAGAEAVYTKPIKLKTLVDNVNAALAQSKSA